MLDYNYNTSSVEMDKVNDILMTQKHLSDMYNNASNEVDCNNLHNEILNILKEEHEMSYKLYDAMKKRGWYDTKKADKNDVDKLYNEFNSKKGELGL